MNLTPFTILIVIALLLSILSIIKPTWPLAQVALILICVALLATKALQ